MNFLSEERLSKMTSALAQKDTFRKLKSEGCEDELRKMVQPLFRKIQKGGIRMIVSENGSDYKFIKKYLIRKMIKVSDKKLISEEL